MRIVLKIDDRSPLAALIRERMKATGLPQASVARMMLFQAMNGSGEVVVGAAAEQLSYGAADDDNAVLDALLGDLGGE